MYPRGTRELVRSMSLEELQAMIKESRELYTREQPELFIRLFTEELDIRPWEDE